MNYGPYMNRLAGKGKCSHQVGAAFASVANRTDIH